MAKKKDEQAQEQKAEEENKIPKEEVSNLVEFTCPYAYKRY